MSHVIPTRCSIFTTFMNSWFWQITPVNKLISHTVFTWISLVLTGCTTLLFKRTNKEFYKNLLINLLVLHPRKCLSRCVEMLSECFWSCVRFKRFGQYQSKEHYLSLKIDINSIYLSIHYRFLFFTYLCRSLPIYTLILFMYSYISTYLFINAFISIYDFISIDVFLSMCSYLSVSVSIYMCVHIYLSIYVCVFKSIYLSMCS